MPPEEAEGLVYLDAHFESGLRVQPVRIDQIKDGGAPTPLEILWYEQPTRESRSQYWVLGADVIFVRRHGRYRDPELLLSTEPTGESCRGTGDNTLTVKLRPIRLHHYAVDFSRPAANVTYFAPA